VHFFLAGSESPAAFVDKNPMSVAIRQEAEQYRQMHAKLLGGKNAGGIDATDAQNGGEDAHVKHQLSNELSAPYELPQYPIEQIETKLIRYVTFCETKKPIRWIVKA